MPRTCRAFSLVEMLTVVLIVAVLAAMVVPRFGEATDDARTSATESILAGVRASVAAHRTRAVLSGLDPYPTLNELTTIGVVLQQPVPPNPFTGVAGVQAVTVLQAQARTVTQPDAFGWNYAVDNTADPPIAIFYANASDVTTTQVSGLAVPASGL